MSVSKPISKQIRIYQPTYQLNPRKPFNIEEVEKILKRIVNSELEEIEYSEKLIPDLCLSLAENIKTALKEESYDRSIEIGIEHYGDKPDQIEGRAQYQKAAILYRIIVAVSIGQRRQQSVHVFHSFLWDHERDRFVAHNFENCHIYANVVVYGVYFD